MFLGKKWRKIESVIILVTLMSFVMLFPISGRAADLAAPTIETPATTLGETSAQTVQPIPGETTLGEPPTQTIQGETVQEEAAASAASTQPSILPLLIVLIGLVIIVAVIVAVSTAVSSVAVAVDDEEE